MIDGNTKQDSFAEASYLGLCRDPFVATLPEEAFDEIKETEDGKPWRVKRPIKPSEQRGAEGEHSD